jgi:inhibitor of KinA sporulation pathway (predicted exonuclease)
MDRNYLIVDIECTTPGDTKAFHRQEMETIEIGAVLVDVKTFKIINEFDVIIKPVRHPELTKFCMELTTITQDMVDVGENFTDAIDKFRTEMFPIRNDVVFASWGNFDRVQLMSDFAFHCIDYCMPEDHVNLKEVFSLTQEFKKQYGALKAVRRCGLQWVGQHHRGIDDARNSARILPWVLGVKKCHPRG